MDPVRASWRHSKVLDFTAQSKSNGRTATSFMKRHFKPYGWILALSGLTLFHKLQATGVRKATALRKSFYLAYPVACFGVFMLVNVLFAHQFIILFLADVEIFTKWIHLFFFGMICLKVTVNLLCVFIKSRDIVDFFEESVRYEVSVNFVPPERYRQPPRSYVIRLLQFVAFVVNLSICSYVVYSFIDFYERSVTSRVALKVACVLGNFLFYVYEMSHSIVLRPCLEVLLLYIRQQHEVLQCVMGRGRFFIDRDRKVEEIRLNLCTVWLLKSQINGIWCCSVIMSVAVALLLSCICIYTVLVEGFSTIQPVLSIVYSIFSVLDILDMAGLSQEMVNEMRSIRQAPHSALTCSEKTAYFLQISYLQDTIHPSKMAICGADFFSLNLPLVVSLAGCVITYTVILVQTNESVNTASTTK